MTSQRISPACGGLADVAPTHECDGTAFGNAAHDQAFLRSLPEEDWTCHCICHAELGHKIWSQGFEYGVLTEDGRFEIMESE